MNVTSMSTPTRLCPLVRQSRTHSCFFFSSRRRHTRSLCDWSSDVCSSDLLDRICISAAAPYIMDDLHLGVWQMSVVFSAFTLAYSIFEIPSGWLGDEKGPRRVLTRIVLWWSAFTMMTSVARGFQSLVAIRFLFGAGEAGAFPNVARSFSRWFPVRERGRANGVMFLGSRIGGMLSAPIALLIVSRWGWRASFVVFGALGVVWAAAWFMWYRDWPEEHPDVNEREIAWIR